MTTTRFKKGILYFPVCACHNESDFICLGPADPPLVYPRMYKCTECTMHFVRRSVAEPAPPEKSRDFGSKAADYVIWLLIAALVGYAAVSIMFPEH
jgi:hypothetical protein